MLKKLDDEIGKSDLGPMAKLRAAKNAASNAAKVAKVPDKVESFKDTIMDAFESLKGATYELNDKYDRLLEIGRK